MYPLPSPDVLAQMGEQYATEQTAKIALASAARFCREANDEGEAFLSQSEEAQQLKTRIDYLMGKQWPGKRPSHKSSAVNNRLLRQMWEILAVLTEVRPVGAVKSEDDLYRTQAETSTKSIKSWWMRQDNDLRLGLALILDYLSTGFLAIDWNPRLFNGMGDFELEPMGIPDVVPIGMPVWDVQKWEGLVMRSWQPLPFFQARFPGVGHMVKAHGGLGRYLRKTPQPRFMPQGYFNRLAPQMKRLLGGKTEYGTSVVPYAEMFKVYFRDDHLNTGNSPVTVGDPRANWSYIVPPGRPLYPRGRLIIAAGEEFTVLWDGPNPYWHGRWPVIPVRTRVVPWQAHGISALMTKIPQQEALNQILAGVLDMIKKAINPPLIFSTLAFSKSVMNSLDPSVPNAKIGYSPHSAPPQYGQPPVLPAFVFHVEQGLMREMDDDSGLLDVRGLARKKLTPAADTLEELKSTQQAVMRLFGRWIEHSIRELGEQMTSNQYQFYGAKRRMFLWGAAGLTAEEVFDWDPNDMAPAGVPRHEMARIMRYEVRPGTLLNVGKEKDIALALRLRSMTSADGKPDMSRKSLYGLLDWGHLSEQIIQELNNEMEHSVEAAAAAATEQKIQEVMASLPPQMKELISAMAGGGQQGGLQLTA